MSNPATPPAPGDGEPHRSPVPVLDVGVAVASAVTSAATAVGWRLARRTYRATTPLTRAVRSTAAAVTPGPPPAWLERVAEDGATRRHEAAAAASALLDSAVSAVATEAFKRLDLAGLIRQYVDLDEVVDGVDAVKLTQDVIVAVDLPDIIRTSTGSMASDTVRGLRLHGVSADDAVARLVGRVLPRRTSASS